MSFGLAALFFSAETATPVKEEKSTARSNMKWNLKKRLRLSDGISAFISERILPHHPDSEKFRELVVETTV